MLFAHVSDLHLGFRQYGLVDRELDFYKCYEELVNRLLMLHVDTILLTGDLFHTANPPPQAYRVVLRGFKRLKDTDIPILYIWGQHDRPRAAHLAPAHIFEELDFLRVLKENSSPAMVGGVEVHGLNYTRNLRESLRGIRRPSGKAVLMLHCLVDRLAFPSFDVALEELPRSFCYYALGDYHNFKVFKLGDGRVAAYPGSIEVVSLNDLNSQGKGFILVDLSGDEPVVQFVKLESPRPWVAEEILFQQFEERLKKLEDQLKKYPPEKRPLVYLKIRGEHIDRKLVAKGKMQLEKLALKVLISFLEEAKEIGFIESRASIEEVINARVPGVSSMALELLDAFRKGELTAFLEELYKSRRWVNWRELLKVPVTQAKPSERSEVKTPARSPSDLTRWL